MKLEDLPNDIDKLKKLIISLDSENSDLKDTILILQRKKFAPSSESNKDQLQLFNEVEDIADAQDEEAEAETEEISYTARNEVKESHCRKTYPELKI